MNLKDVAKHIDTHLPSFETSGLRVRLKADRSKIGVNTGETESAGRWTMPIAMILFFRP